MREFLEKNSSEKERNRFFIVAKNARTEAERAKIADLNWRIVAEKN